MACRSNELATGPRRWRPPSTINHTSNSKRCTKCRAWFPCTLEYFARDARARDGLQSRCRICDRQASAAWRKNHPEAAKAANEYQRIRRKEQDREYQKKYYCTHTHAIRLRSHRRRQERPLEVRAAIKRWERANPHTVKESRLRWQRNHYNECREYRRRKVQRRRAKGRALPHDLTKAQWQRTLLYFCNRCAYCGLPQRLHIGTLQQDHVLPFAQDGGYTQNNIVPACVKCNGHKHNRTPEQAGMFICKPWPPD